MNLMFLINYFNGLSTIIINDIHQYQHWFQQVGVLFIFDIKSIGIIRMAACLVS